MPVIEVLAHNDFTPALTSSSPEQEFVFVDFYAKWCGPCRRIAPKLDEFSTIYPKLKFLKVDVDKCPELATKFNIAALPTFLVFRNGNEEVIDTIVGANLGQIEILLNHISETPQDIGELENDLPESDESLEGDSTNDESLPDLIEDEDDDSLPDNNNNEQIEPSLDL
jgi:thioredoxin 1